VERYSERINELEKTIDRLTLDVHSAETKCQAAQNRLTAEQSVWKTERTALEDKLKKAREPIQYHITMAFLHPIHFFNTSPTWTHVRLNPPPLHSELHRATERYVECCIVRAVYLSYIGFGQLVFREITQVITTLCPFMPKMHQSWYWWPGDCSIVNSSSDSVSSSFFCFFVFSPFSVSFCFHPFPSNIDDLEWSWALKIGF